MTDGSAQNSFLVPMAPVFPEDVRLRHVTKSNRPLPELSYFSSGRVAIARLLQYLVSQGRARRVLLPEYHCFSMVSPCKHLGLDVEFYRLDENLQPDLDSLDSCLSRRPCLVFIVHFFGYPTITDEVEKMCARYGVDLLEDGSHVNIWGRGLSSLTRQNGRWWLGSLRKHFPVADGAYVFPRLPKAFGQSRRNILSKTNTELRSVKNFVDNVLSSKRTRAKLSAVDSLSSEVDSGDLSESERIGQKSSSDYIDPRFDFDHGDASRFSVQLCRLIRNSCNSNRNVENYRYVVDGLSGQPGIRMLFDSYPDDAVPFVAPILVDKDETWYRRIRREGVQLLRWEQLGCSAQPKIQEYTKRLIQFPIHSGLSREQLRYAVATVCNG